MTELLSLPSGTDRWLGWKQTVPVQLESGGPVKIAFGADGNGSALLRNARLALGDGESVLSLQALDVDATLAGADPPHGATRLDATLDTRARGQQFPQLAIALGQQGSARDSDLTLKLTDATDSLSVQAHGHANLTTGSGDYRLDARVENLAGLAAGLTPPLRHLGLLHNRVDIRAGSVSLDTALKTRDWDPANWDQQSRLSLQGVSGNFDDYRFDGLALAADWSGVTRWKTSSPLELSLATLNPGFDIRDIQARVSLPKSTPASSPRVNIESFSARMFGGQLLLGEPQAWDFSARSNRLTLQAAHWQLAEMVALQKNEDIRAQGVLEGELPVSITDGRVVIDEGYLRALPPGGSIRYTPNDASRAAAAGSPELAMALDLLSDFQYQVLRAEVRLDGAGNLLLGLSLSGSNPAKYAGQPVNFNINLEQNIDPLLQSLRLSDTLVERIEGGLQ